jgi:hypothetical protein
MCQPEFSSRDTLEVKIGVMYKNSLVSTIKDILRYRILDLVYRKQPYVEWRIAQ